MKPEFQGTSKKIWDAGPGTLEKQEEEEEVSVQTGWKNSAAMFTELLRAQCG